LESISCGPATSISVSPGALEPTRRVTGGVERRILVEAASALTQR